jgi:iron complex transport system substrate-binding protein
MTPATRIVSLCPSITDSVFALGKGAHLVGRTKFCVQPRGQIEAVERVGGTKNPKLDRILALAPDLVLMNEEENRREDAEALRAAGIRVVASFARDVLGAAQSLRELGAVIGAPEAAERLAEEIEAHAAARASPSATFLYLIWRDPLMTVAPGTYVDSLLTVAGGRNVITAPEPRYPAIDAALLARADRILLASEPFPFAERHLAELAAATGIPAHRFARVDGELLSWHGAKTLAGLAYAREVLRPRA